MKPRKRLRFALFSGALLSALGFFLVKALAVAAGLDQTPWWDFSTIKGSCGVFSTSAAWLQTAFDVLLSSGAAVALFMDVMDFEGELRLFERASLIFQRASEFLRAALAANRLDVFSSLAVDLAREAVGENFEWNDSHRRSPVEMPMG